MTRAQLIERIIRQVSGGEPNDDSQLTWNLVNLYCNEAIALAAKNNYIENAKLDNINYVSNSFYTSFRDIDISSGDDNFIYTFSLPSIPVGIGHNEGIASVRVKKGVEVSQDLIPLSINQQGYADSMQPIPNKTMYWYEGDNVFIKSVLPLNTYKAMVRMISGGDSTDLNSTLILPPDYLGFVHDYVAQKLMIELKQPQDEANDGRDLKP